MTKKVLFVLSDFQSGGTEWFAIRLAEGLTERGIASSFMVATGRGELRPFIEEKFPLSVLPGMGYSFWGLLRALPAAVKALRTHKPDAIICGLPLLNIFTALAVKLARLPAKLILVEHMRLCPPGQACCNALRSGVKAWLIAHAYASADKIVAASQTAAQDLECLAPGLTAKTSVIYNPVIPQDFERLVNLKPSHPWLEKKTGKVILSVGRLLPVKDYPTLLDAFAHLPASLEAKLIILGEGECRAELEALIASLGLQDRVSLPGVVSNVFSFYKAADLFVLSSQSEAFGNVVAEALACGTKVVCTSCGGPNEILQGGRWGRLVEPGNVAALTQAMRDALNDPPPSSDSIAYGKSFSVGAATEAYIQLINS